MALVTGALAADWPIFRGDRGLTGVAPGKLPDKLALLWKFKFAKFSKASAVIADGQVFIGGADGIFYAVNLKTGKQAWTFKTKAPIEAPALALDGRVYFGDMDGYAYALDAKTGEQAWKFETGDQIVGGPNWMKSPDGKISKNGKKWLIESNREQKIAGGTSA